MEDSVVNIGITLTAPFWYFEGEIVRCWVPLDPSEYGQCELKVCEVFRRVITHIYGGVLILVSLPVAVLGHGLMELGMYLGASDIQSSSGLQSERVNNKPKILHLNTCMFPGSLPIHFGGMSPASFRIPELVGWILQQDADIVMLGEVGDLAAGKIEKRLKNYYTHFYTKIGMKPFGMGASLFIASRLPCDQIDFTEYSVRADGSQKFMKRGFVTMDLGEMVLFYTHLHPGGGDKDDQMREAQLTEIRGAMDQVSNEKKVMLAGDLNIDYRKSDFLVRHNFTWIGDKREGESRLGELSDYILSGSGKVDAFAVSYIELNGLSDHPGVLVAPCQRV